MTDIWIIVVLYNPGALEAWVRLAASTRFHVLLVDNGSSVDHSTCFKCTDAVYLQLDSNTGIGHAQNVGIEYARARGATQLVFFDQDSRVDEELVGNLIAAYTRCKQHDGRTFAVGPTMVDAHAPSHEQRQIGEAQGEFVRDDYLASSGTVVRVEDALKVGRMNVRLFISDVDYEWVWRAASKGMYSYRSTQVRMVHPVGEKSMYVFGRKLGLSKPARYYYQVRNWFLLRQCPYVPRGWRFREARDLLASIMYLVFFGPRRLETVRNALRGFVAGLRGSPI